MHNLFDFFIRFKNTLLFLFLLFIALFLTIQTHSYHKSKFISSANFLSGGLYSWSSNIDSYFHLKENNVRLLDENKRLRKELSGFSGIKNDSVFVDTTHFKSSYTFYSAEVIANRYTNLDNFILINKGKNDSISAELGVITSEGIVGVVENTSAHYSRVISILNTNLDINAQLKNSDHFGTLHWKGENPNLMQLSDVPRLAKIKKGDTIITNGRSLIFPKGIPVGTVKDFQLDNEQNYYEITVKLFNDMTNIGYVYVIKNNDLAEIKSLQPSDE